MFFDVSGASGGVDVRENELHRPNLHVSSECVLSLPRNYHFIYRLILDAKCALNCYDTFSCDRVSLLASAGSSLTFSCQGRSHSRPNEADNRNRHFVVLNCEYYGTGKRYPRAWKLRRPRLVHLRPDEHAVRYSKFFILINVLGCYNYFK